MGGWIGFCREPKVALVEPGPRDQAVAAVDALRRIEPRLPVSACFRRIRVPVEARARPCAAALLVAGLRE
jgi:hypothetical protein